MQKRRGIGFGLIMLTVCLLGACSSDDDPSNPNEGTPETAVYEGLTDQVIIGVPPLGLVDFQHRPVGIGTDAGQVIDVFGIVGCIVKLHDPGVESGMLPADDSLVVVRQGIIYLELVD